MYFNNCNTLEEAKILYRALVKIHHPDVGGDTRTMQDIIGEYSKFCATFAKREGYERQRQAHAENRKSAADFHNLDEVAEVLRVKIEFALNLDGVEVELMGFWVWLTGNTKAHKDAIKAQGFKWAKNKEAWFFAGVPSFNRKEKTLDEIRDLHGSQSFARQAREENAGVLHS